jgi:hypothetical protein
VYVTLDLFLLACSNQAQRMKDLWSIEDSIDYQNITDIEKAKIEKVLQGFLLEEKEDRLNWNSGYSQQCYVLRKMYFEEIISLEVFLTDCINVYKRYESQQTRISFHTVGYAICIYYLGQTEKAKSMFVKILDTSTEKNFASTADYEISIAVCNKLLGVSAKNNLMSNELFSTITDTDIISIFCGN